MDFYIPWRVRLFSYRIYQQLCAGLSQLHPKKQGMKFSFYCNYHQTTGATVAIASIANHLAEKHNVDVFVRPQSGYSRLLQLRVRQTFSATALTGDIVFVDIEQENSVLEQLLQSGKRIALTCHAFPTELHAVPQPKLIKNLELSSFIHFVSEFQREEFIRHYPHLDLAAKSFVIPNFTRQSQKKTVTGSVGIVGYLSRPQKNALHAIKLSEQSKARTIECWGSDEIAGVKNLADHPKVVINGWADSPQVMHESFDVLISASLFETFGLVVSEALSAGIPCVLSDIPVFRSLYGKCKGVAILTGDDEKDIARINQLLNDAPALKADIMNFWRKNFSNETVKAHWFRWADTLSGK